MANLTTLLETQQAIEATLLKKLEEFDKQLKATVPQGATTLTQLHEEFQDFKAQVLSIFALLRQQIAEFSKSIDVIETRHRRKYLLFIGIPEDIEGSLSDYIVKLVVTKLGLTNFNNADLTVCHRLGKFLEGKCRPVLVRFSDSSIKSDIWRKKVALKGSPIALSEFLTKQRQSLFLLARKHLGMRNCWTSDGNIIVKLQNGSLRRISTEEELTSLAEFTAGVEELKRLKASASTVPSELNHRSKRAARSKK